MGFHWDADKLRLSQAFISLISIFSFFSVMHFVAPKEKKDVSNGSNFIVVIVYRVMVIVFGGTLMFLLAFSMFCQKTKRHKLYTALDRYEKLMSFYGKEQKSQERKNIMTLLIAILYHIFLMILSPAAFQYSLSRIIANIFLACGNFVILQNQCFLNGLIFILRKNFEFTKELFEENEFSQKQIMFLKLKLHQIMELFNSSFGLLLLFKVTVTFFTHTCNYYLLIGKTSVEASFSNSFWLIILQLDNLPLNIVHFLLFYESEKVNQQERFNFFVDFI